MNKIEFLILSVLLCNDATSRYKGMSLRDILSFEDIGIKDSWLYKQLKEFQKSGFVDEGAKDGKASTFFITRSGIANLEEEKSNEG